MSVIKLNKINKFFGSDQNRQQVLNNVSLQIEQGDMVSIMGPSGSGKSTLLNIIGLLDRQTDGEYLIDDYSVSDASEKKLAHLRSEKFGFVFQSFNLISELSALDNVKLGLQIANIHKKNFEKIGKKTLLERSVALLELVGLKEHLHKKPSQLSGGQQQRVAIARALINNPEIIIADEPTGALDQKNAFEILNIFKQLNNRGITVLIVTHDNKVAEFCEKNIDMLDGVVH